MDTYPEQHGKTTIAPDVLVTIARLSALGVPGVARLSPVPGGVNQFFQRGANEGVQIEVKGHAVAVELYLVLQAETSVREVARNVQAEVTRAIQKMVGMDVEHVNVHIEDVELVSDKPS
jgi:uncharacterized alkaline shock family protein YloU